MIARLQGFYGGDPRAWMQARVGQLRSLHENLRRLEAERLLGLHSVVAAASGRLNRQSERKLLRSLERQASEGQPRQRAKKATAADMEALGIQVVRRGSRED